MISGCCVAAFARACRSSCLCCWYVLCDMQAANINVVSGATRAAAARFIVMHGLRVGYPDRAKLARLAKLDRGTFGWLCRNVKF
jgi:hypothetical protein